MGIQITFIGLGQIGASVGLALGKHGDKFERFGFDFDPGNASKAKNMKAIDKTMFNIPNAVKDADIVFMAVPMDQVRELLLIITPNLKEGAVIMDTSPTTHAAAWAVELLPKGRYFVNFTPMIGPFHLHQAEGGVGLAREDLFDHGLVAVTAPRGTVSGAMKLASDLAGMIGAVPLFADEIEVDSYMAANHLLPQFVAASLVASTAGQTGWQEGRKFAGRPYAQVSSAIGSLDTPAGLACAAALNKENILRVMGNLITELQAIKGEIEENQNEDLIKRLETATSARAQWLEERGAANWSSEQKPDVDVEVGKPKLFGSLFDNKTGG